jgi:hypothetical protein
MHSINVVESINLQLTNGSLDVVDLINNSINININPRHRIVSRNKLIKNLKAYASIKSLDEITLPDFEITDSETQKLYKTLDIEWGGARKEIGLYIKNTSDDSLFPIGQVSLINPSGYPYRTYNLLDLLTDNLAYELGGNGNLAIGVNDVGYGTLAENDVVSIYGSYVEEIVIDDSVQSISSITEQTISINSQESKLILPASEQRKYVFVQNTSNNNVYISLSSNANERSIKILPNGHFEIETNSVAYYGIISVFSENNSSLLVIEGV